MYVSGDPDEDEKTLKGSSGTTAFSAPEMCSSQITGFDLYGVDIWACGVIYMAMRTGRHLWKLARKDEDDFYKRYLEGRKHEDGYAPIETLHRVSRGL